MVARMQKMKAGNLTGIGNHNQRKTDKHSNKDIDVERSHLNYDLVEGRTENYKTDIQEFIDESKSTSRAVRKDAVLVNEWIISSDKPFFENKDDKEIERFFEETKDYFADKFGDNNIRYAQVHLDETTPHMHLGVVPFDKENKLSAKRVFNRATLIEIQDELPALMQERGFAIQRGEKGSERKNMTVPEYKAYQEQKKALEAEIGDLKQESKQRKDEIVKLSAGLPQKLDINALGMKYEFEEYEKPTGEKTLFGQEKTETRRRKTGNLVISKETFKELSKDYSSMATANEKAQKYLQTDVVKAFDKLFDVASNNQDVAQTYMDRTDELERENSRLKEKVDSLKGEIKTIYHTFKDTFKQSLGDIKQVKGVMRDFAKEIGEKLSNSEFSRIDRNENKPKRFRGPRR